MRRLMFGLPVTRLIQLVTRTSSPVSDIDIRPPVLCRIGFAQKIELVALFATWAVVDIKRTERSLHQMAEFELTLLAFVDK